jgi:hypothetical protein
VGQEEDIDLIMLGRPTAESSIFGKERFLALVSEIEQRTNIPVLVLETEAKEDILNCEVPASYSSQPDDN